ncbi:aminodeoxychorismate lyase [Alkanindiges illinoisensis]|uniref:Aminodeoxychorismate lyase n=1 Tax=Alkanindiges illinoisensis TaxID=197183 RepID=A0A4Y7XEC9_9GAMM|nr:aminodeoxychorismate lyase [Alkanindiges illinoisensis]TEU30131.1 aminodeoxychorismate lyase [Alkanindiges illinoisensis]
MISIKNGNYCQHIDCQDRAFLYGDGFFTTIRLEDGKLCLWQRHIERLIQCADQLGFNLDIEILEQQVQDFLKDHDSSFGTLKIIISRGLGERGYLPPEQSADIYIQFFPAEKPELMAKPAQPIDSGLLQLTLGHVMPAIAGLKTLNRMEQVLLRQELAATKWPEALVSDIQGNLIEGVYSNCFFYMDNKWYTPLLDQAGIAGVMRAEILAQMLSDNIPHLITYIPKTVVDQIEALFFCNALTGIVPVKSLNGRPLTTQPVEQLKQKLRGLSY